MHADKGNSTCACQPSGCTTAEFDRQAPLTPKADPNTTRLFVIGDSISIGMKADLISLLTPHNWSLSHNPGNGDNTNFGAHCVPSWVKPAINVYDVISFQFGLHDIAYDEERLSVEQYTAQLTNITSFLVSVQQQHGTKLLWVKTTPVPTVPMYGPNCTSSTKCLNPPRYDSDVVVSGSPSSQFPSVI